MHSQVPESPLETSHGSHDISHRASDSVGRTDRAQGISGSCRDRSQCAPGTSERVLIDLSALSQVSDSDSMVDVDSSHAMDLNSSELNVSAVAGSAGSTSMGSDSSQLKAPTATAANIAPSGAEDRGRRFSDYYVSAKDLDGLVF